ncbi:chorismate synthase [Gleimia sp. 6138-11-ORH1]|uniref:chorismate synthase n=1 Tax=Gleimia sp. 6138-11-ORH1 TaxID=2973937 RepID=UPI0021682045|nr:chorismate synthase [Gleimia sp. 6138-11-ORH1]MCS4484384.1 chorismate synthase [Gleimia sp. 6138-11-ORH1]
MIRWLTAGESHGPVLTGIIEGIPAGIVLCTEDIEAELARRRSGYGRGARQKIETDKVTITAGVRHGITTGAPISIQIANAEWEKWQTVMSADPVPLESLKKHAGTSDERELARNQALTRPRPGHADLAGALKYDHYDIRNVLERASARETAMRVALGTVAKAFLKQGAQIEIVSHVTAIGTEKTKAKLPSVEQMPEVDKSPLRTTCAETSRRFQTLIDEAKQQQNTIGGKVEVAALNVPIGLGTHTQWDQRLDAQIGAAMLSIQSAKSVEIGSGQTTATGKEAHDPFTQRRTQTNELKIGRQSNHAGGLEGGISNGETISVEIGFKPISTVPEALTSFDFQTKQLTKAIHQRSDTCAVVPAAVISEAMLALVIAKALTEMFGSSTLKDLQTNLNHYQERLNKRLTVGNEE